MKIIMEDIFHYFRSSKNMILLKYLKIYLDTDLKIILFDEPKIII